MTNDEALSFHLKVYPDNLSEALDVLRNKPVKSTTYERVILSEQGDLTIDPSLPQPIKAGRLVRYLLERVSVDVRPYDILPGRVTDRVLNEQEEKNFQRILNQYKNRARPGYLCDNGHACYAWSRFLNLGFHGLQELAREKIREFEEDLSDPACQSKIDYDSGCVQILEGFRIYCRRYSEAALAAGLKKQAENCAYLADHKPETFYQAMMLIWLFSNAFFGYISANPTVSFGRMDQYLLPYYRKDIQEGRLTEKEAEQIILDFYCKNNLQMGRGEHQNSGGSEYDTGWDRNLNYDAPQYIILGGMDETGKPVDNELTRLFLRTIVPRFENPVVIFRWCNKTPPESFRLVCDKMRQNASMMLYNDHQVISALTHYGMDFQDASQYVFYGCNWPTFAGNSVFFPIAGAYLNPPKVLLEKLEELTSLPDETQTFEKLLSLMEEEFYRSSIKFLENAAGQINSSANQGNYLQVDDCLFEGPIESGKNKRLGSLPRYGICPVVRFAATMTDSLYALHHLIFLEHKVTPRQFLTALQNNWENCGSLYADVLKLPKCGQDNPETDAYIRIVHRLILNPVEKAIKQFNFSKPVFLEPSYTTDSLHIQFGEQTGATPDGRKSGEPFSASAGPSDRFCSESITAMLNSAARLPDGHIVSGPMNIRIHPKIVSGDNGLILLAALLQTYFEKGGLQAQLSIADTEMLLDAQKNPEQYQDLMVRITGYSAVFVDMSQKAQNDFIRRSMEG